MDVKFLDRSRTFAASRVRRTPATRTSATSSPGLRTASPPGTQPGAQSGARAPSQPPRALEPDQSAFRQTPLGAKGPSPPFPALAGRYRAPGKGGRRSVAAEEDEVAHAATHRAPAVAAVEVVAPRRRARSGDLARGRHVRRAAAACAHA